jgi:hypothetical protein
MLTLIPSPMTSAARMHQVLECGLAGSVGGGSRAGPSTGCRAAEDDGPAGCEQGPEALHEEERALDVGVEHHVPGGFVHIAEAFDARLPGIEEGGVEVVDPCRDLRDGGLDAGHRGEVGLDGDRAVADQFARGLQLVRVTRDDDHACALACERLGGCQAQSSAAAGDKAGPAEETPTPVLDVRAAASGVGRVVHGSPSWGQERGKRITRRSRCRRTELRRSGRAPPGGWAQGSRVRRCTSAGGPRGPPRSPGGAGRVR